METVAYRDDRLIISIPASDPAALHAQMMQSIVSIIRHCECYPEKPKAYETEVVPLLNLLTALMPGERELSRAFRL